MDNNIIENSLSRFLFGHNIEQVFSALVYKAEITTLRIDYLENKIDAVTYQEKMKKFIDDYENDINSTPELKAWVFQESL
jgi:shikimate 5-dehydrogenase